MHLNSSLLILLVEDKQGIDDAPRATSEELIKVRVERVGIGVFEHWTRWKDTFRQQRRILLLDSSWLSSLPTRLSIEVIPFQ